MQTLGFQKVERNFKYKRAPPENVRFRKTSYRAYPQTTLKFLILHAFSSYKKGLITNDGLNFETYEKETVHFQSS